MFYGTRLLRGSQTLLTFKKKNIPVGFCNAGCGATPLLNQYFKKNYFISSRNVNGYFCITNNKI